MDTMFPTAVCMSKRRRRKLSNVQLSAVESGNTTLSGIAVLRGLVGPTLFFTGLQLMPTYPILGICICYFAFVIALFEIIYEPWILRKPIHFQVGLIVILLFFSDLFTIQIFHFRDIRTIAQIVEAEAGSNIAGIKWYEQFSELRVAIHNPDEDRYRDINVIVRPDAWVYDAAIFDTPPDHCKVEKAPANGPSLMIGETKKSATSMTLYNFFGRLEMHDSAGNPYYEIATVAGYRLTCDALEPSSTVQLVFATVTLNPMSESIMRSGSQIEPGKWGFHGVELRPPPGHIVNPVEDFFGSKPTPTAVEIDGIYKYGALRHRIKRALKVAP